MAADVNKAVRGPNCSWAGQLQFGTALLAEDDPLLRELRNADLECVPMSDNISEGGRKVEVFLDATLASALTAAEHLLDSTFAGALNEGEVALSDALRTFRNNLPAIARQAPAWRVVEDALGRLGDSRRAPAQSTRQLRSMPP